MHNKRQGQNITKVLTMSFRLIYIHIYIYMYVCIYINTKIIYNEYNNVTPHTDIRPGAAMNL